MKLTKILLIFSCSFIATSIAAQVADIYGPFLQANPSRIESTDGYCMTQDEERKLWSEINKFAKSVLQVFPTIPPEQASYLMVERNSGNFNRQINIGKTSFYKIDTILNNASNLEKHSADYLKNHNQLTLQKKMEFIGRTLLNVDSEPIAYDEFKRVSADLALKDYFISEKNLSFYWAVTRTFRTSLMFHLTCYGDRPLN